MLELYGWESVFYISGLLAVLWAYCVWKFMLKGEGKCSNASGETGLTSRLTEGRRLGLCAPTPPSASPAPFQRLEPTANMQQHVSAASACCAFIFQLPSRGPAPLCLRVSVVPLRADHHAGVAGKRRSPVQTVQTPLAASPQAACCLVSSPERPLLRGKAVRRFSSFCSSSQLFQPRSSGGGAHFWNSSFLQGDIIPMVKPAEGVFQCSPLSFVRAEQIGYFWRRNTKP